MCCTGAMRGDVGRSEPSGEGCEVMPYLASN
jgi:hypothetical protein